MVEENPRDVGHEMDELSIVYGDESLSRLYENSRISSDQLPGQSGQCIFIFFFSSQFCLPLIIHFTEPIFPLIFRHC